MSYNTRRTGGNINSAASVGQRRPGPGGNLPQQQQIGNFVSGGVVNPNMTNKPVIQTSSIHQSPQQPQQQQGGIQRQQPLQQQQQQQQQNQQTAQRVAGPQQPLQQQRPQQFGNQPQPNVNQPVANIIHQVTVPQPKVVFKTEPTPATPQAPKTDEANTNGGELQEGGEGENEGGPNRRRPFWRKPGVAGKVINKRERVRRRNERLRRLVQPKNALMVLNELVTGTAYNVFESNDTYEGGNTFKCILTVDGKEHTGSGKSKPAAKNSAAEAALKYMVLTRYKSGEFNTNNESTTEQQPASVEGEEKMDTSNNEDSIGPGTVWSYIASYALHKLLSSWDEGAIFAEMACANASNAGSIKAKTYEKKPAKKLPGIATAMNPVMLLNQMHPNITYEDVNKIGNPPHVQFTVKCVIQDEEFFGTAPNKKAARKVCAFNACIKVLGIQYTPEFLEEHGVFVDEIGKIVLVPKVEKPNMEVETVA